MTNAVNLASLAVSGGLNADANGDVGVGVTPSPWTLGKALEIGTAPGNGIWGVGASNMNVVSNVYFDGAYKFAGTGSAGTLAMSGGGFAFASSTASGVAGGTISFTDILGASRGNTLYLQGASSQSGTGITFPATQNASSNANTLDDYEEGTWTPSIAFGGASVGVTYSTRAGNYTKIGRVVHFWCLMNLTSKGSSTGNITITGIPFTASDTGQGWLRFSYNASLPSFPVVTIDGGEVALTVRGTPNNMDPLTNANIAGTAQIQFAGFYYA